ncbi:E3 ubiquitin-protein ligase RNF14-like isoform X2 [Gouania willdenowi]|uniref:E3 ubiquitin-protein ligase RNF14-like isoform X2 n=1 Tax=Gouania willdenowi TaxID=441366 RepID=UPI001055F9ED|nr:E3 ubiquitin-protein ligase RNF14-like isoform X2 [Gouania willdenowi]
MNNPDPEEQEDELLALHSILNSEEFVRDESKSAGECRVSVELPAGFTVLLREGETGRQYEISSLPPLLLTFELPKDYPSSSAPSFTLTCSWLTNSQLSALSSQLVDLYKATSGSVVLFSWLQFLREDALLFLNIHNVLELPADGDDQSSEADRKPDSLTEAAEDFPPSLNVPSDPPEPVRCSTDAEDQEGFSGEEEDVSALLLLNSSSDPSDPRTRGATSLSVHSRVSQNEDQSFCEVSVTPSQALLSQILICDATHKQKVFDSSLFDCGVCFLVLLGSECVQLSECGHVFCQACLREFCTVQITEGNVQGVTCPQADCKASPTPAQVKRLVGDELFSRYDRLLLQFSLESMSDVIYCPRMFCGSAVIMEKSGTAALCSVCGLAFCVTCRKTYHGTDDCQGQEEKKMNKLMERLDLPISEEGRNAVMDDFLKGSKKRKNLLIKRYGQNILKYVIETKSNEKWIKANSKPCPRCSRQIEKNGGCDRMTCTQCSQVFNWQFLTKIDPPD